MPSEPKVKIKAKAEIPAKHAFGKKGNAQESSEPNGGQPDTVHDGGGDADSGGGDGGGRLGDGVGLTIILMGRHGPNRSNMLKRMR
jgi:hypothetical protein